MHCVVGREPIVIMPTGEAFAFDGGAGADFAGLGDIDEARAVNVPGNIFNING